jgi:hypothetical protein
LTCVDLTMKALLQDDERFHHRSWIYEGRLSGLPFER